MSEQAEVYNLDRQVSLENMIDPTGKKWEIHGSKGTALVHARPNPDRSDAQIPKQFSGQWTSPSVLKGRIVSWLKVQWNMSEEAARKAAFRAGRTTLPPKKTPEESLAELPDEIKEDLGDLLAIAEENQDAVETAVSSAPKEEKPAKKKAVAKPKKRNKNGDVSTSKKG